MDACDLCGATDFTKRAVYPEYLLFTGERFTLVTCRACGLHFVNPRPTRAAIGRYYPADYAAHLDPKPAPVAEWQRQLATEDPSSFGFLRRLWLQLREDVSWYMIPRNRGDRRILDLGAGSAKLLDIMRPLGWDTYAVELSAAAVERACAKGHKAIVGAAEDRYFEQETFDVVYMWHVLEHLHQPSRALRNVHESLRPGGQLIVCVPNFNSAHARVFGKYWWSSDAPRHLFQFTRKTLGEYLSRAGFRNIKMTTRTGATSWVRAFRHTLNGLLRTRWQNDPAWLVGAFESMVVAGSLVRYLGVGSELRVTCER